MTFTRKLDTYMIKYMYQINVYVFRVPNNSKKR